jgi:UDP-N-acetylmuramoyl-tripeptide--D-alanyl-D-alanine ligase
MNRDLARLASVSGGTLHGANRPFGLVSTDSRNLDAGALFVALQGERFDGHDFIADVAARGAAGVLVSRAVPVDIPQVVVSDSLAALSRFANAWRRQFAVPVVGITGSNGKTTTKELAGSILQRRGPCLVTQGNLNNHIGVPLMLCRLAAGHRTAVIEMGANHQREIAHLAALAEPDIGLVVNAGPAHLEGFGGIEGVAKGKGEMFEALGPRGVAVINADDRFADFWRGLASNAGQIVTFGIREAADFRASAIAKQLGDGGFVTAFELQCPLGGSAVRLRLAGEHNVMNALAAAAVAGAAGASLEAIVQGLEAMRPVAGRLEVKRALHGARLIDDSYNANPGSLRAGLRSLAELPGERWLVLGEMAELGQGADVMHAEIGEFARKCGVSRLLAIGNGSREAVEAFGPGGSWFGNVDELIATARADLKAEVTVLIKGSRVNRLERVAAALAATPGANGGGH